MIVLTLSPQDGRGSFFLTWQSIRFACFENGSGIRTGLQIDQCYNSFVTVNTTLWYWSVRIDCGPPLSGNISVERQIYSFCQSLSAPLQNIQINISQLHQIAKQMETWENDAEKCLRDSKISQENKDKLKKTKTNIICLESRTKWRPDDKWPVCNPNWVSISPRH